jgi:hypothetical protein
MTAMTLDFRIKNTSFALIASVFINQAATKCIANFMLL